jgi:hypothetical protein
MTLKSELTRCSSLRPGYCSASDPDNGSGSSSSFGSGLGLDSGSGPDSEVVSSTDLVKDLGQDTSSR